jgi:hypothetical protein
LWKRRWPVRSLSMLRNNGQHSSTQFGDQKHMTKCKVEYMRTTTFCTHLLTTHVYLYHDQTCSARPCYYAIDTKSYTCLNLAPIISHSSHTNLRNIKHRLQLLDQLPLIHANIAPEELLERVDTLPAKRRVQSITFFQVATVHGLVGSFDFDGDGGLALFADGNLFVVALD